MKATVLSVAALLSPLSLTAAELLVHTGSIHAKRKYVHTSPDGDSYRKFNNVNIGLGYRSDSGWSTGAYLNSYNHSTAYAAYEYKFSDSVGVVAGLASGYKYTSNMTLTPIAALVYRTRVSNDTSLSVMLLPPAGKDGSAAAHFVLGWKIP